MSIEIYPDTKVYVVAPANVATGGPELLHQLVYHLRKDLNIDAYIYYVPNDYLDPVHPELKHYNVPFVRNIEDKESNILIVPERYNYFFYILNKIKPINIRKIIWWLSVDNFIISFIYFNKKNFFWYRVFNKILRKKVFDIDEMIITRYCYDFHEFIKNNTKILDTLRKEFTYHLAQSYYAIKFLKDVKMDNIYYLSDYLNQEFLKTKIDLSKKKDIIAYNPRKGHSFTKKLIKKAKNLKFVPIQNMSRKEVIELLKKAKVYIDFGNHPGKDRIPREAAILGCCVITGKRGSAAFEEDVPIPKEYKFEDKEENIPKIIEKIKDCFENFESRYKDFENYREIIKKEPEKFLEDLKKTFVKVKS